MKHYARNNSSGLSQNYDGECEYRLHLGVRRRLASGFERAHPTQMVRDHPIGVEGGKLS
jgi:hypothetical protein